MPSTIKERESRALFPTYDRLPIGAAIDAKGVYITTDQGTYLDCISGLGVCALGHSHPAVLEAISTQAAKYLHLSNLYLQTPQVLLAEALQSASGFERVFFSNSGAEAVEGAMKLARKFFNSSSKFEIVGIANGFHGRTYGPLSVMDKEKYRAGYGPFLPGCSTVGYDIAALERAVSDRTAAVIVEPIQGEGGIIEIPEDFVVALKALKAKHDFLIIADEIQSCVGRTGTFLACEQIGLNADVAVIAKAVGGGLPLGAVLSSEKIAAAMAAGVHGTTFGGNALACAAGLAVVNLVVSEFQANAMKEGQYLKDSLMQLVRRQPEYLVEVRGRGMMLGLQFKDAADSYAKRVWKHLLEESKIIANVTGHEVLRLLPPLIFEREHSDRLLAAIESAITSLSP
jgi:acetylornithine/N-succinyldiaminopimelate aminotransferase